MDIKYKEFIEAIPVVADAAALKETCWFNDKKKDQIEAPDWEITPDQIRDAADRLDRFAPYLEKVFPELAASHGIIESELRDIPNMKRFLNEKYNAGITGSLMLKMDSDLPLCGSVKARGGIYEILKHAEELAVNAGKLRLTDDYSILAEQDFKDFFSRYTVQVGSTGNLGLSVGIISAKLGFHVIVHMSSDAKQWKKDLLREHGVEVIEYAEDYCRAVEEGRKNSGKDPMSYFVDDENSRDLFLGYAVTGKRLREQLEALGIKVDETHPLFVYIPCGIGGAPGGITYGIKQIYGNAAHCFFAEPTHACCMLLGLATGLHDKISVNDLGIDGKTEADGLAVSRPSAFVGKLMEPMLSGIATILDDKLYDLMRGLYTEEGIFIEPSSCAAFAMLIHPGDIEAYAEKEGLAPFMDNATHIAWATGGGMVPEEMRETYMRTEII